MNLNTFTPVAIDAPVMFEAVREVEDVQLYFCHHLLSLITFGKKKSTPVKHQKGFTLVLACNEDREAPHPAKIVFFAPEVSVATLNESLLKSFDDDAKCLKVETKEIYRGARFDSLQYFNKDHLQIYLINPVTEEPVHVFWKGSMADSLTEQTLKEPVPC